ncbi:ATP-dependent DNA ligase [Salinirubrum litoreum]|uniref:DNA ligase n=1 Tax=Salinirubrum litoreum TaxID=1126234 RepID=A0ABD5RE80_9EURY|nr:ATP-dependent DNA ligase [Salinirubrum litoreum]
MQYAGLVAVYDDLAGTDSTNAKRDILAETFADADPDLLDRLVTLVRGRLGPAYDRPDLGVSSSLTLDAILTATGAPESEVREQWRATGDLGDAAAWAVDHGGQQTLFSEPLTVARVHDTLREVATYAGDGSQGRSVDAIAGLLADADTSEARYVVRTALGHLRVGVGEGTIRDAVAHAFLDGSEESIRAVERAYQVTTDFRVVARTAREAGREGLADLDVEIGRPVQSMLAEKAERLDAGLADAAGESGESRCEYKYDGIRVQVHVAGDDVWLFTRRLADVTAQFPDVVRAVREGVTADSVLLDGELVGYTPESIHADPSDRVPVAFQRLSQRVKRESRVAEMAREVPVVAHLFDCLAAGETLLDRPLRDRLTHLAESYESVAPDLDAGRAGLEPVRSEWVPADTGDGDPAAHDGDGEHGDDPAESLYREALDAGHEGLMLKNPDATYEPGRRVGRLLKLKPTMEPLDLVVSRATYSEGRRSELLGRLYLACYDPETDALREVGRVSTGYTDAELQELTDRLEESVVARDGRDVTLDPDLVLEVEYEEIQSSTTYDSGFALRFPRFLGIREDLAPTDADSLDRVQSLYDSQ